jgi:putative ATPase
MIFLGPPGTGTTTLARMTARQADAHFIALSAVMAGILPLALPYQQVTGFHRQHPPAFA